MIAPVDVTAHQQRLATLRTAKGELEALATHTADGTRIRSRHANAARAVAQLRLRDSTSAEIRSTLSTLAETIGEPPIADTETTQDVLTRLITATETAQKAAIATQANRKAVTNLLVGLKALTAEKTERAPQTAARKEKLAQLTAAQRVVKRERDLASSVGHAATEARSAIVGRVFNERLNAIWRDLFIRLAPNEPFVPAFMLPAAGEKTINARLETVHRDGGTYGRPGAMLSVSIRIQLRPPFRVQSRPLWCTGFGLIHVVHRRDPRPALRAPQRWPATAVGGSCAPTWVSPGGGPGEGFSYGF